MWVVPTFLVPMHLYTVRAIVPLAQVDRRVVVVFGSIGQRDTGSVRVRSPSIPPHPSLAHCTRQIQATVQHCRFDLRSPIDGAFLDAGSHDLHHWDPSCNYGLYTNVIDKLMGTHKRPKYKGATRMAKA